MLIKFDLKGIEVYPSQIKRSLAYKTNVIIIVRSVQGKRVLFVDYVSSPEHLGSYEIPPFLQGKLFYFELIEVPSDYVSFIKCITRELENKLSPVFKNKKLQCSGEVTVVIE